MKYLLVILLAIFLSSCGDEPVSGDIVKTLHPRIIASITMEDSWQQPLNDANPKTMIQIAKASEVLKVFPGYEYVEENTIDKFKTELNAKELNTILYYIGHSAGEHGAASDEEYGDIFDVSAAPSVLQDSETGWIGPNFSHLALSHPAQMTFSDVMLHKGIDRPVFLSFFNCCWSDNGPNVLKWRDALAVGDNGGWTPVYMGWTGAVHPLVANVFARGFFDSLAVSKTTIATAILVGNKFKTDRARAYVGITNPPMKSQGNTLMQFVP